MRRMEKVLPNLIHSDQTGFGNGRYIGQNIRLLNDIMEYTDIKKLPGIFLFVDSEKAFDTLGSMKHNTCKILELKSTREPVKVLEIFLSSNQDKNIEENFLSRISKMKIRLNLWLSRNLTLYGKSLMAKTLGVSQLVYAASLLSVPNAVTKIVQTQLFSFVWKT